MGQDKPTWFAVYTKPRQEKIALENLERQGFRCSLPMAINPYQKSKKPVGAASAAIKPQKAYRHYQNRTSLPQVPIP